MLWGLYQTTKTNAAATVDGDDVQTTPTYIYSWMLEDRINIGLRIQLRVCRIISGFRQQAPMVGAAELERVARSLWGN
ncbi:hypothetical protein L917_10308 [Phytophthora nicotianae]|uniref:Uncharacterized protein n=1 Tax=Phytophthora nicotianae TaxID=4792 RepID=W2IX76_PHYNI|nr:hypothetical protein L916_10379 [Phytophthora nicotianae]ETL91110.1 hypothetical protein L917_10308 [Phytophthora nicotianae]ETM44426.1 hypothetical protein L914_10339 [Phytophthora nicotianae]